MMDITLPHYVTREDAEMLLRGLGVKAFRCVWDGDYRTLSIKPYVPDEVDRLRFQAMLRKENCQCQ
jgi:hypothetical protein